MIKGKKNALREKKIGEVRALYARAIDFLSLCTMFLFSWLVSHTLDFERSHTIEQIEAEWADLECFVFGVRPERFCELSLIVVGL